jgi:dTDP-glucose 4,6-dehydratase
MPIASYWQEKRVVVTGAGGFIGSHLVEVLVRAGASVRAFVRYNSRGDYGHLRSLPSDVYGELEVVTGDLRDHSAVRTLLRDRHTVFHLAALIGIPYSYVNPNDVVETNVLGTLNVLNAARDLGLERVVQTSTSEVYGTAQYAPIDERHPLQGQSPYSASKIGADKLAESYYRSFDLPVTTVRPFNTYGPRQSTRAVIPTVITQALSADAIRLGSLQPRRDFLFVRDTVAGFMACAESVACVGEVVNLGTGSDVTVGEIVGQVQQIIGRDLPIITDDQRVRPAKSEVLRLICDNRKAHNLAGWSPTVNLSKGLDETVAWMRVHLEQYKPTVYAI